MPLLTLWRRLHLLLYLRLLLRRRRLCAHGGGLWRRLLRLLRRRRGLQELLQHLLQLVDLAAGGGDLVAHLAAHLVAESLQIRGDLDVLAAGGCWRWRLRRVCGGGSGGLLGRHHCCAVVMACLVLLTCAVVSAV